MMDRFYNSPPKSLDKTKAMLLLLQTSSIRQWQNTFFPDKFRHVMIH